MANEAPTFKLMRVDEIQVDETWWDQVDETLTCIWDSDFASEPLANWSQETPPRGGFPAWQVPNQDPEGRGAPSKNLYHVLRGGSSSSGFFVREPAKWEPPRGGGGRAIKMCLSLWPIRLWQWGCDWMETEPLNRRRALDRKRRTQIERDVHKSKMTYTNQKRRTQIERDFKRDLQKRPVKETYRAFESEAWFGWPIRPWHWWGSEIANEALSNMFLTLTRTNESLTMSQERLQMAVSFCIAVVILMANGVLNMTIHSLITNLVLWGLIWGYDS